MNVAECRWPRDYVAAVIYSIGTLYFVVARARAFSLSLSFFDTPPAHVSGPLRLLHVAANPPVSPFLFHAAVTAALALPFALSPTVTRYAREITMCQAAASPYHRSRIPSANRSISIRRWIARQYDDPSTMVARNSSERRVRCAMHNETQNHRKTHGTRRRAITPRSLQSRLSTSCRVGFSYQFARSLSRVRSAILGRCSASLECTTLGGRARTNNDLEPLAATTNRG